MPDRQNGVILRADNVTKIFLVGAGVKALDGLSLDINRGEFVLIAGPSGCGKSTLLNLLGGLDRPTYGEIMLKEHTYSSLNENGLAQLRRHNVGFVFQAYNLLNDLTARENVELPMRLIGMKPADISKRCTELLEAVGLGDRMNHYPHELSGGEQQRVAVARALANQPAVVLADEPTGNLDSKNSAEVMDLFLDLNRERHQTFVVVSHDSMARRYASRIVHMRDGTIEKVEMKDG